MTEELKLKKKVIGMFNSKADFSVKAKKAATIGGFTAAGIIIILLILNYINRTPQTDDYPLITNISQPPPTIIVEVEDSLTSDHTIDVHVITPDMDSPPEESSPEIILPYRPSRPAPVVKVKIKPPPENTQKLAQKEEQPAEKKKPLEVFKMRQFHIGLSGCAHTKYKKETRSE